MLWSVVVPWGEQTRRFNRGDPEVCWVANQYRASRCPSERFKASLYAHCNARVSMLAGIARPDRGCTGGGHVTGGGRRGQTT